MEEKYINMTDHRKILLFFIIWMNVGWVGIFSIFIWAILKWGKL